MCTHSFGESNEAEPPTSSRYTINHDNGIDDFSKLFEKLKKFCFRDFARSNYIVGVVDFERQITMD